MTHLTTNLESPSNVPYFMWDEPMTVAEIVERLKNGSHPERLRLTAKILREARDTDVWCFFRPAEIVASWNELAPRLGRRREFWEYLLSGWREERTLQGSEDKLLFGRVRVDPAEEIFANKLCALLSRGELRDIVDIIKLEQAGFDLSLALELASKKDGGLTYAQLAWVISQIDIGDDAKIPAGLTPEEARIFLAGLEKRLKQMAFPRD